MKVFYIISMNSLTKKPKKKHAIELSALHPEMTQKEIAK